MRRAKNRIAGKTQIAITLIIRHHDDYVGLRGSSCEKGGRKKHQADQQSFGEQLPEEFHDVLLILGEPNVERAFQPALEKFAEEDLHLTFCSDDVGTNTGLRMKKVVRVRHKDV